ncbi:bacteriocin fulvocin C-related protein [Pedobacter sp. UC225_65]|uniref:bacteriocin fulvocin C-related protein n=1 Tax=Pedobacter sp. UC225_65 TaxID=3350173 RepID=UPI0036712516
MKKNIKTVCLLALGLLIMSCSKDKQATHNDVIMSYGKQLLKKITSINDEEAKKLAYSALSNNERYNLWAAKLAIKLLSNDLSSIQKEKLSELKNYLKPEIFQKGDAREIFHAVWFPNWAKNAENIFNPEDIYNLVLSINSDDITFAQTNNNKDVKVLALPPHACICALNSNYTCGYWSISWPPGYIFGTCKKSAQGCLTNPETGCGALYDNECDGDKCDKTVTVD